MPLTDDMSLSSINHRSSTATCAVSCTPLKTGTDTSSNLVV